MRNDLSYNTYLPRAASRSFASGPDLACGFRRSYGANRGAGVGVRNFRLGTKAPSNFSESRVVDEPENGKRNGGGE